MYTGHKVNPVHKILPKTSTYVKGFDGQTRWVYFLIEDDDLLEKYHATWDKVSSDLKEGFDSEPVYDKQKLKTKIKSHGDEVTDFYDKEIPKLDTTYTCLAVTSWDSVLKKDENYYLLVFLIESKYMKKIVFRHINDNLRYFHPSNKSEEEG